MLSIYLGREPVHLQEGLKQMQGGAVAPPALGHKHVKAGKFSQAMGGHCWGRMLGDVGHWSDL